jgi:hypothetical protein
MPEGHGFHEFAGGCGFDELLYQQLGNRAGPPQGCVLF